VSNSESALLHKDKRNAQQVNTEEKAKMPAAVHPGLEAAAAAAAITIEVNARHQDTTVTIDASTAAQKETPTMNDDAGTAPQNEAIQKQGESQARATKDDRIGIDHHPTTVIHYPPPSWRGGQRPTTLQPHTQLSTRPRPPWQLVLPLTPPAPPLMTLAPPEICQGKDAPPQLPPPHLWYRQPPPTLPSSNMKQKLVGYKRINNNSGHTVPVITINNGASGKSQNLNKNNAQNIDSSAYKRKTAQQQSARTQAMPPLPPLLQHHGIRTRIENNAGAATTEQERRANANSNYEAQIMSGQGAIINKLFMDVWFSITLSLSYSYRDLFRNHLH
jgi:hypothetical protein